MASIRETHRNEDGTSDIVAVGTRRFLLHEVDASSEPYLVGRVSELEDRIGDEARARRLGELVSDRFVRYVELIGRRAEEAAALGEPAEQVASDTPDATSSATTDATDEAGEGSAPGAPELERRLAIPDDPGTLSYLLGGILAVEPSRRQALLEAETAEARLAHLAETLEREILLLDRDLGAYVPDSRLSRGSLN